MIFKPVLSNVEHHTSPRAHLYQEFRLHGGNDGGVNHAVAPYQLTHQTATWGCATAGSLFSRAALLQRENEAKTRAIRELIEPKKGAVLAQKGTHN